MNEQVQMLEKAAKLLAALNKKIVFIGGATISLYLDEVSAVDARPTNDVDCVINIIPRTKYYLLEEQLRQIGLEQDQGKIICRWRYQDLIIDIMPADTSILGFSNPWYKPGIKKSIIYNLPSGQKINIFPVTYLLASKIEAFNSRGNRNFMYSHDLEDIILLLDGCPDLEAEIQQADIKVKKFIRTWFKSELEDLIEIAPGHLSSASKNAGREQLLLSLINSISQ
jgi:Nucleotidyl transferase AbiEii toxin, Type IV TA system